MGGKGSKAKKDASKKEESKKDEPKKEEVKKEEPKKEEPKQEPKKEEPKPEEKKEHKEEKKEHKEEKKEEKEEKKAEEEPRRSDGRRKSESKDPVLTQKEKDAILAKRGGGARRGSVIDELNALERTKSYNKIEEVAGTLPPDVRVLTARQKEELWDFYDKDKNGQLDMTEMKTVMRHLMRFHAKHANSEQRKSIELRAMIMTPYQLEDFNEENLAQRVFNSLDIAHSGHIKREDFLARFTLDHEACKVS